MAKGRNMTTKCPNVVEVGAGNLLEGILALPSVGSVRENSKTCNTMSNCTPEGIYFAPTLGRELPQIYEEKRAVPVMLVPRRKNVGVVVHIMPKDGRYGELIDDLTDYRLDGYGAGRISRNPTIDAVIADLGSMPEVGELVQGRIGMRSEMYEGPGCYNLKEVSDKHVQAVICGKKHTGVGREVEITPALGYSLTDVISSVKVARKPHYTPKEKMPYARTASV